MRCIFTGLMGFREYTICIIMKIFIFSDTHWSLGRVHRDVMKQLPYEVRYTDWAEYTIAEFFSNYEWCDRMVTNLVSYLTLKHMMTDFKKVIFVSHGAIEHHNIELIPQLTYGVTTDALIPLFPEHIKPFLMPNGVDPNNFNYKPKQNGIHVIGWCGAPHVHLKQIDWAKQICKSTNLPLEIASDLSYDQVKEWYNTIDLLLVTSIPISSMESGPLPAFEAIVSGVAVIGTPVGNFRHVPGPKFKTIEEGIAIVNELKGDPEQLFQLAKLQYDYVMKNYTYEVVAKYWKHALEFS